MCRCQEKQGGREGPSPEPTAGPKGNGQDQAQKDRGELNRGKLQVEQAGVRQGDDRKASQAEREGPCPLLQTRIAFLSPRTTSPTWCTVSPIFLNSPRIPFNSFGFTTRIMPKPMLKAR